MTDASKRLAVAVGLLGALLIVGACREEGDVIFFEPHVYKGPADPGLSQETVSELEARAKLGARL